MMKKMRTLSQVKRNEDDDIKSEDQSADEGVAGPSNNTNKNAPVINNHSSDDEGDVEEVHVSKHDYNRPLKLLIKCYLIIKCNHEYV